ncbi:hypothetical protein COV53_02160 [Candidatus Gottesmanbacteria bacterium CG11_big_fil_rev_8_21_14_0_20_37_11]|uniref:Nucleotidyl transferase AbiEii/AbiGii toxin family protein n=2 Tax=Candidatus Gottesmaniibacteriota TaxID=1752720 RepID=A0A2M7RS72_9BACT|nr:MAG: hypothetical protein COX23_02260 [Candidatus Gottesmanbacteria bacterium CG23_combo_of_CG06-09_8_20_14_all_37_19]PIR08602.1 MAG: hypothetical protein COV53_02160 [Candidatus Gottesmanbacteria bacterium CG11_big_fil_rev_8_21_14_0_20_37_11]PIZ03178.1 MAG: hypothetical protein COY59_00890 [Candidatus Gottesmanbacteria bacterium CG_4_10_14_0_8_um_filter_37_24]HCX89971.1 hypothetical protein [Deltaproteobacteria bacterium]
MAPKTILNGIQKRILSILCSNRLFTNNFYLTGGTALSEYYLHHRLSEDLDFFCFREVDKLWLSIISNKIKRVLSADKLDILESFNRNLVYFTVKKRVVKTEFTYFPFEQIETPLIISGLKIDSLTDIAVNKFFTIYQNPSSRHFIDLYLILMKYKYSWSKLEELARIKFETAIDPIQLGSQIMKAEKIEDYPKMLIPLSEIKWRKYFVKKAALLKHKIAK